MVDGIYGQPSDKMRTVLERFGKESSLRSRNGDRPDRTAGNRLSYRHQRHPFRRGGPASFLFGLLLGTIGLIFAAIGIGAIVLVIAVLLGAGQH